VLEGGIPVEVMCALCGMTGRTCEHSNVAETEHDVDRGWTVVLGPGQVAATRADLALWREANADVLPDNIRLDLIRTSTGDQLRVLVRA
jgi:hypothetical protein